MLKSNFIITNNHSYKTLFKIIFLDCMGCMGGGNQSLDCIGCGKARRVTYGTLVFVKSKRESKR